MTIGQNSKLMHRIAFIAKLVTSKIQNRISIGYHLKEEVVQIIQICKLFSFFLIFFLSSNLLNSNERNQFGNYLSWSYARLKGDLPKVGEYYSDIDFRIISQPLLEELFFESVTFEDWEKATEISKVLKKKDSNNFSADLYLFVNDFLVNNKISESIQNIDNQYFDINFIKALLLWTNKLNKKKSKVESVEDCIPLICIHTGIFLMQEGKKAKSKVYFDELLKKNFSSHRIKELLFLNFLELKDEKTASKIFDELSLNDMNLKKYEIGHFKKNRNFLNPVLSERDAIAEVFYNISSWYYQKNLYKYSAFFGKLSLRIRPDFNAMKLLLVSAYEQLGFEEISIKTVSKIKYNNPYFMKFLKIKTSLYEIIKRDDQEIIDELKVLAKNFPENWEIKLLLADKLRASEKYDESISLYSDVIKSDSIDDRWVVFYSRGIAYERLNKWHDAERDLKEAMRLEPNDPYVINYLAYSWLDRNINLNEALDLLKKAVELEPADGYIMDSLGWAYYLTNAIDKSVYYLEKAVSFLPNDATLNDHLGDAYWKLGRKEEAISQWKRVLIIKPKYKKKKNVIDKINNGLSK